MSAFRDILERQQRHEQEAARLRRVLKTRFGFEPERVAQTMQDVLLKRFAPERPHPPMWNGRRALKGEFFGG